MDYPASNETIDVSINSETPIFEYTNAHIPAVQVQEMTSDELNCIGPALPSIKVKTPMKRKVCGITKDTSILPGQHGTPLQPLNSSIRLNSSPYRCTHDSRSPTHVYQKALKPGYPFNFSWASPVATAHAINCNSTYDRSLKNSSTAVPTCVDINKTIFPKLSPTPAIYGTQNSYKSKRYSLFSPIPKLDEDRSQFLCDPGVFSSPRANSTFTPTRLRHLPRFSRLNYGDSSELPVLSDMATSEPCFSSEDDSLRLDDSLLAQLSRSPQYAFSSPYPRLGTMSTMTPSAAISETLYSPKNNDEIDSHSRKLDLAHVEPFKISPSVSLCLPSDTSTSSSVGAAHSNLKCAAALTKPVSEDLSTKKVATSNDNSAFTLHPQTSGKLPTQLQQEIPAASIPLAISSPKSDKKSKTENARQSFSKSRQVKKTVGKRNLKKRSTSSLDDDNDVDFSTSSRGPVKHQNKRVNGSDIGCWTCKVRRKGCDRAKPECNACTVLGLPCAGYASEKPNFMIDKEANANYRRFLTGTIYNNKKLRGIPLGRLGSRVEEAARNADSMIVKLSYNSHQQNSEMSS